MHWTEETVRLANGSWCLTHPNELISTFFLSLPETINTPKGVHFPFYEQMNLQDIQRILDLKLDFTWSAMEPNQRPDTSDDLDDQSMEIWSNKYLSRASVLPHHAISIGALIGTMDAATAVADKASGAFISPHEMGVVPPNPIPTFSIDELDDSGVAGVTVVEVTVPLRVIGSIPTRLPDEIYDAINDIPEMNDFIENLPSTVPTPFYSLMPADEAEAERLVRGRIIGAFHTAIQEVNRLQSAYHAATRLPLTLLTRERSHHAVPLTLRLRRHMGHADAAKRMTFIANDNLFGVLRPDELSPSALQSFSFAMTTASSGAFRGFLDLHREADVRLRREGDTRASAIFTGLASEALWDELLLRLMWEEAATPEKAAAVWESGSITKRVRKEYAGRIGGSWDTSKPGPLRDWLLNVTHLRNSVVHTGAIPTYTASVTAIETLNALVTHLCDLMCSTHAIARYPRAAHRLVSPAGLEARGAYTNEIRKLEHDATEPLWDPTFERWRDAFNRCRIRLTGAAVEASLERAFLMAIFAVDGSICWVLHDRVSHLAVTLEAASLPKECVDAEEKIRKRLSKENIQANDYPLSIAIEMDSPSVRLAGDWQEEYHFIPMAGVMVNKSDFAQ